MKSFPCQICQSGRVEGIAILPLRFDELERANELRRNGIGNDPSAPPGSNRKNSSGSDSPEVISETWFIMLVENYDVD